MPVFCPDRETSHSVRPWLSWRTSRMSEASPSPPSSSSPSRGSHDSKCWSSIQDVSFALSFCGCVCLQNILKRAEENSDMEANAIKAHHQLEQVAFHKLPTISWVNFGPFLLTDLV
ncbi:unnamed protein product [Oncorhynchus mykiss]|uniref:Uncharacterized protein n=1 Tax=Oncorhynchus mykiss TaxID=8022 RepID=A0A060Z5K6_ONCMY|nr:unnamed protein product [Oncorhynchus mykiss]